MESKVIFQEIKCFKIKIWIKFFLNHFLCNKCVVPKIVQRITISFHSFSLWVNTDIIKFIIIPKNKKMFMTIFHFHQLFHSCLYQKYHKGVWCHFPMCVHLSQSIVKNTLYNQCVVKNFFFYFLLHSVKSYNLWSLGLVGFGPKKNKYIIAEVHNSPILSGLY